MSIQPNLTKSLCNSQRSPTSLKYPSKVAEIHQKRKKLVGKTLAVRKQSVKKMAAVELRCDHVSTTDRTVLSHPSTVPSPPDEARRLQPHTELLVEVAVLLQDWIRLRRGAHRGIDRRVALQCAVEFCELLAEEVQRFAAAALDPSVPRVPPQGSQQRVRHRLRRQPRPAGRALQLQQLDQRVHGLVRILRVWASRAFFFNRFALLFLISSSKRRGSRNEYEKIRFFICLGVFLINHLIFKDKTSIQFATPTCDCSLVALNVTIEIKFQRFPAGSVESWHGSDRWGNGRSNGLISTQQLAQAKRQRLTQVQLHP